ncbi:hypothetical protein [Lacisediminihabitans sp.]|uniref:hypothetical protein n=1 Tax=Lacisediminihabitans sp. TaxID=2787631 RepID=UPI00374D46CB
MARFEHTTDVARGSWIAPRLTGGRGTVTGVVPAGFECYVRVFHPVNDGRGGSRRWAAVCAESGAPWHPLAQWESIRGAADDEPLQGSLGEAGWALLSRAIGGDADITVGLWTGYGSIATPGTEPSSIAFLSAGDAAPDDSHGLADGALTSFDADVRAAPLLVLPGREYALFAGKLSVFQDCEWRRSSGWAYFWPETVNLAWPDDRSWFAASEIDFDSTIVGTTRAIAERILASGLEAAIVPADGEPSIRVESP